MCDTPIARILRVILLYKRVFQSDIHAIIIPAVSRHGYVPRRSIDYINISSLDYVRVCGFFRREEIGPCHPDRLRLLHPYLFIFHLTYYPRTTFALSLPVSAQIRGHTAGPPLPSALRRYGPSCFIARRIQHFLASSAGVELYLTTLLGAPSDYKLIFFLYICK